MEILTSSVEAYRRKYPKVYEVPFNSCNKYHITINESPEDKGHWLCMKGAPERIIERCTTIFVEGKEMKIDETMSKSFMDAYMDLGGLGERVIGKLIYFMTTHSAPHSH